MNIPNNMPQNPSWRWWQNEDGTWVAGATFHNDETGFDEEIEAPVSNYDDLSPSKRSICAEVEYKGIMYYSPEKLIEVDPSIQNLKTPENLKVRVEGDDEPDAGNVIPFPGQQDVGEREAQPSDETPEGEGEAEQSGPKGLEDLSEHEITVAMKQVSEGLKMMQEIWRGDTQVYQVNEGHIRQLYKFNEEHRDHMPPNLTQEEMQQWDHFNGIKKLTDEDIEKIFGSEHVIIGVDHDQTMDRINTVVDDFFNWTYAMNQYKEIYNAYREWIEIKEEGQIDALRAYMDKEEDPEKKAEMQKSIDLYYYRKDLGFLADELDDRTKKRLADAWADERRLDYWLKRSTDKLKRMKIASQVIMEIYHFEQRFMDYKYFRIDNMLLVYFMNIVTYCKPDEKDDENRSKAVCMVFALDAIIRNIMPPERRVKVMDNITAFMDQMLEYMPEDAKPAPYLAAPLKNPNEVKVTRKGEDPDERMKPGHTATLIPTEPYSDPPGVNITEDPTGGNPS